MSKYQVAWNAATHVALVQDADDTIPVGTVNIGEYEHTSVLDELEFDVNHVLWHHVRDLLYKIGKLDMQKVSIEVDSSIDVTGVNLLPANFGVKMGATTQLTVEFIPARALNKKVTFSSSNPNVLTVSSTGLVTPVANGIASVTVTTEEGSFTDSSVGTVTTAVTGVTLTPDTAGVLVGVPFQLTATVGPFTASNKAVAYLSSDPTVATVSASGLVTPLKNGTVIITVRTVDGEFFDSTTLTATTAVTGVTVAPTTRALDAGASFQIDATVAPATASNKAVSWTSSNPAVATVSNAGLVTGITNGTATITVTTADGNRTATTAVTVAVRAAGMTLSPKIVTVNKGSLTQLTPVFAPANTGNKTVAYSSSNPAFATVDTLGRVTGVAKGTVTITGTSADGSFTDTASVTVNVPVTFVTLNKSSLALNAGASEQMVATVSPADATNAAVTWTSSNTAIAVVNGSGLVTGVAPGTANITVTTVDGANTAVASAVIQQRVTGINVSPAAATLNIGSTQQLTPNVTPANATNKAVTYTSFDPTVATVNGAGVVTALKVGSTGIQIDTVDGGFNDVVTITVQAVMATAVSLTPETGNLTVGQTQQLTSTFTPSNTTNKAVSYASYDTGLATVSPTGLVTAVAPGTCGIQVTTTDGGFTDVSTFTITAP